MIGETEVERVNTFKFLKAHISEDLTWTYNSTQLLKKAQQRLYFLRKSRQRQGKPKGVLPKEPY